LGRTSGVTRQPNLAQATGDPGRYVATTGNDNSFLITIFLILETYIFRGDVYD